MQNAAGQLNGNASNDTIPSSKYDHIKTVRSFGEFIINYQKCVTNPMARHVSSILGKAVNSNQSGAYC